jgi:hypothetical protein
VVEADVPVAPVSVTVSVTVSVVVNPALIELQVSMMVLALHESVHPALSGNAGEPPSKVNVDPIGVVQLAEFPAFGVKVVVYIPAGGSQPSKEPPELLPPEPLPLLDPAPPS